MPPEITQSIIQLANFDHSNKANNIKWFDHANKNYFIQNWTIKQCLKIGAGTKSV